MPTLPETKREPGPDHRMIGSLQAAGSFVPDDVPDASQFVENQVWPARMLVVLWASLALLGSTSVFVSTLRTTRIPVSPSLAMIGALVALWAGWLIHGRRAIFLASIPGYFSVALLVAGRSSSPTVLLGLGFLGCQVWNLVALRPGPPRSHRRNREERS